MHESDEIESGQTEPGLAEARTRARSLVHAGELEAAARLLESTVGHRSGNEAVELALELFDLRSVLGEPAARRDAAMLILESAAASNSVAAWIPFVQDGRLTRIEDSFQDPIQMLEALEQEALAPEETGLAAAALSRIEQIGHVNASDAEIARYAERLLHALGDTAAAYRVERSRHPPESPSPARTRGDRAMGGPSFPGLKIAIVGGYPALRALIRRDLQQAKIAEVREIPSSWEGSRVGRDVQATIHGVDVALLLVREVGHSTSNQVKRAAQRVGVPVVLVESASTNAVRRALARFANETPPP